jgi:exodeoxyribonuclease V beta subunit
MNTAYFRRPEILRLLEPGKRHAVIEASAGTGKTYTLEHLVLDILIRGQAKIEEILVVTFTDAATRELRERVRTLIRRVCDESGDLEPDASVNDYWAIDDSIRSRLREALFRFDGAQISTIHGFCHRVLSEQAFLGGRLFEQEHVDGAEMFGFAFREEARRVLVEQSGAGEALRRWLEDDKSMLKLEQFLYRCHREGCPDRCPVTPEWDPEAFKEEMADLPDAEKLKEAGRSYFADKKDYTGLEKIINSFIDTLLQGDRENHNQAVGQLFEWAIKKMTINKRNASRFDHLWRMAEMDGAPDLIVSFHGKVNRMLELAAGDNSFFVYKLLPRVQNRLAARKRSLGLFDYDDMLLGVLDALTGEKAAGLIGTLRKRWKFALVDEFQDTDPVQWAIFKKIFVDGTDRHYLYIIGDPKQAIYSFRGADVHTYEQAKTYLTGKCKAVRLPLMDNFRSTEALIEAINEILTTQDDCGSSFFTGLNSYNEAVKCGDRSRVALEEGRPAVPVHLLHLHGRGDKLYADLVRKGVARFIGEEISRLLSEKGGLLTGSGAGEPKPIKLSDIYILTRSASEGQMIGAVLRRFGIPHAFYKQEGLFQTTEADDLYRLLCAVDTPTDPASRMAAWLTPFFGIDLSDLQAWKEAGESHPLAIMLHDWKHLADDQAWSKLFEKILTETGLVRRLVFADNERALTNYLHLLELLLAETHAHPVTLSELVRNLKARIDGRKLPEGREGDIQRLETDRDAVQILTMHKAKGLEASVIFIAGGFGDPPVDDINMNIYHRDNRRCLHIGPAFGEIEAAVDREIDEENQRLIYVALTRAKARLYLPYFEPFPAGGNDQNSYVYKGLGRLYRELQKQLDQLRKRGRFEDGNCYILRPVDCLKGLPGEEKVEVTAEGWPEEGLLELPPSREAEVEKIKPAHRGVLLTSYTRMNRGKAWQAATADLDDGASRRDEEVAAEAEDGFPFPDSLGLPALDSGEGQDQASLPGGRETGIMLHALLEITPAEELKDREFASWAADEKVKQRAAAALRRHGFAEMFSDEVLQLVYNALRTPLRVENLEGTAVLTMPGGLASGKRHCPEMFFSYPIPEEFHPLLGGNDGRATSDDLPPYRVMRGFLQGLIDLVFEHEKKIYLLDWKSDRLPSYERSVLADHVEKNYDLQARVYSLAVIRLLNISSAKEYEEKFGGILYAFIRGVGAANAGGGETRGIWFSRPTFEKIAGWERALVKRTEWGGDVISSIVATGTADAERGGDSGSEN